MAVRLASWSASWVYWMMASASTSWLHCLMLPPSLIILAYFAMSGQPLRALQVPMCSKSNSLPCLCHLWPKRKWMLVLSLVVAQMRSAIILRMHMGNIRLGF